MALLTQDEIRYFQVHQNEITQELLSELRKCGKTGKQQALDILDMPQDEEKFYLDAYGERISYNGSRGLKKSFTKLKLYDIHLQEIERCSNDILYFLDNYIKMTTPKDGFNFIDSRDYQRDFLKLMSNDSIENIISMQPRQASKTTTCGVKLAHLFCFERDLTIGIIAYNGESAREFLDKAKKMIIALPIWIQPGMNVWNKGSIECENNVRILTDVPSGDSFRGFTCNIILVDECVGEDTFITIRNKYFGITQSIKMKDFYFMMQSKEKILELFKKIEISDYQKLEEYVDFCLLKSCKKEHLKTDEHHILPKASTCFPEYVNEPWNKIHLPYKDHYIAHSLLALACSKNHQIVFAWNAMTNRAPKFKNGHILHSPLLPEEYELLKTIASKTISEANKGIVTVKKDGKYIRIPREEYLKNKEKYSFHNDGCVCVTDKATGKRVWVKSSEYSKEKYSHHTTGCAKFLDVNTGESVWIESKTRKDNHIFLTTFMWVKRGANPVKIQAKDFCKGDIFLYTEHARRKKLHGEISAIKKELSRIETMSRKSKKEYDRERYKGRYREKNRERQRKKRKALFEAAGKEYKPRAFLMPSPRIGTVAVYDKHLNKNTVISKEEFEKNRDRYCGITKGLIGVKNKETGEIKRIPMSDFDSQKYFRAPCGGKYYEVLSPTKEEVLKGVISEVVEYFKNMGINVTPGNIRTAAKRSDKLGHHFYYRVNAPGWEVRYAKE